MSIDTLLDGDTKIRSKISISTCELVQLYVFDICEELNMSNTDTHVHWYVQRYHQHVMNRGQ